MSEGVHAARFMKMSGRSVSRGMPIRFSIITALSAVIGREPLTRDLVVGSPKLSLSASSVKVIFSRLQYWSSGSQRRFLGMTIRSVC
jgi:hypothetical protein